MKQVILPISIIIATIGSEILHKTIASILDGDSIPTEIIIILPPGRSVNIKNTNNKCDLKIVNSPKKGQVSQRAFGFQFCSQEFILQADDDIYFDKNSISTLFEKIIAMKEGIVLSPILYYYDTRECGVRYRKNLMGVINSVLDVIFSGARYSEAKMGTISPIGVSFGVDDKLMKSDMLPVDWVPGIALCRKDDLITFDYYPFGGKAYGEDVIHSILWKKKGLNLYILKTSIVYLYTEHMVLKKESLASLYSDYFDRLNAAFYILKIIQGSKPRFFIWAIMSTLKFSATSFFKKRC